MSQSERRTRLMLTGGVFAALVWVIVLATVSDRRDAGTVGMFLLVLAGAIVVGDLWFPLRRPAVAVGHGATLVKSRLFLAAPTLTLGTGFGLMSFWLVSRFNAAEDVRGRGAGVALILGPPLTLVLLVLGVGLVVTPNMVWLTKDRLRARYFLRARDVAWDELASVSAKGETASGTLIVRNKRSVNDIHVLRLKLVEPTFDQLKPWLEFYRDNPASRDELGTQASIDRLNSFGAGSWWANPQ